MKREFTVSSQDSGMKLLAFLRKHYTDAPSVKALKRAIDTKGCVVNGRIDTISTRTLSAGDHIIIELDEKTKTPSVLYEDDELLICNKPAGIVSEAKQFPGKLVHRLDKETSGVLILAKTEDARQKMIELFSQKKVHKQYLAIVNGEVKKREGTIISLLAKKHSFQGQTIYGTGLQGQEAITRWKCLGVGKRASLLLCEPVTGRTHQLRVHLKEMGHPILGDTQYGDKSSAYRRHMLHAWKIAFGDIEVIAQIPEDFLEALRMTQLIQFLDKEEKNRRDNK